MVLEKGTRYPSKIAATHAVSDYCANMGGSFKAKKSDQQRMRLVCRAEECPFEVYFVYDASGDFWEIRTVSPDHECYSQLQGKRGSQNRLPWIVEKVICS